METNQQHKTVKIARNILFTDKTTLFRWHFQTLNARDALSSNVHMFTCQNLATYFMRETAVKLITFFLEILMFVCGSLVKAFEN